MKEIEKPFREIITVLQVIHQDTNLEESIYFVSNFCTNYINWYISAHKACLRARELFQEVRNGYDQLDKIIPTGQYYRYNDHWRNVTQRLSFLAALIVFLEKGILIDKEVTAEILGGIFFHTTYIIIEYNHH